MNKKSKEETQKHKEDAEYILQTSNMYHMSERTRDQYIDPVVMADYEQVQKPSRSIYFWKPSCLFYNLKMKVFDILGIEDKPFKI